MGVPLSLFPEVFSNERRMIWIKRVCRERGRLLYCLTITVIKPYQTQGLLRKKNTDTT